VFERPFGPSSTLCWHCHGDVWAPLAAQRGIESALGRSHEQDDHIVEIVLTIGWCSACKGAHCCVRRPGTEHKVRLYFTPEEFGTMYRGMAPGVVCDAPQASRQASNHLSMLRIVKQNHTLVDAALLEMIPYVNACLAVDRRWHAGWRGWLCGCTVPGAIVERHNISRKKATDALRALAEEELAKVVREKEGVIRSMLADRPRDGEVPMPNGAGDEGRPPFGPLMPHPMFRAADDPGPGQDDERLPGGERDGAEIAPVARPEGLPLLEDGEPIVGPEGPIAQLGQALLREGDLSPASDVTVIPEEQPAALAEGFDAVVAGFVPAKGKVDREDVLDAIAYPQEDKPPPLPPSDFDAPFEWGEFQWGALKPFDVGTLPENIIQMIGKGVPPRCEQRPRAPDASELAPPRLEQFLPPPPIGGGPVYVDGLAHFGAPAPPPLEAVLPPARAGLTGPPAVTLPGIPARWAPRNRLLPWVPVPPPPPNRGRGPLPPAPLSPVGPPRILRPDPPPPRGVPAAPAPPPLPPPPDPLVAARSAKSFNRLEVNVWGGDSTGSKPVEIDQIARERAEVARDAESMALQRPALQNTVTLLVDPQTLADPTAAPLALQMGPVPPSTVFFENNAYNTRVAIVERQIKPWKKYALTKDETEEVKAIATAMADELRSDKVIDDMITVLGLGHLKSSKWSLKRAETALRALQAKYDPQYQFTGSVKLEPMQPGKAPRLIVADGDYGQVMAWMTIGVLERWIVRRYKGRTIKGMGKKERMQALAKDLAQCKRGTKGEILEWVKTNILENDGSAWDACCSAELREVTENILCEAVAERLKKHIVPEAMYIKQHGKTLEDKYIALRVTARPTGTQPTWSALDASSKGAEEIMSILGKQYKVCLAAVRRSGHRGTSILNWIINYVCWMWVIFGREGAGFAANNRLCAVDIFGIRRMLKMIFEGDDSILSLTGLLTDDQLQTFKERWEKLGHRPKLFKRKPGDAAEFCGWKFLVGELGIVEGTETPDVPRQFKNGHTTRIKEAISMAVKEDKTGFAACVVPGIMARAYTLAEKTPNLARYFLNLAELINGGKKFLSGFDREALFNVGYEGSVTHECELPEMWKPFDPEKYMKPVLRWRSVVDEVYEAVNSGMALDAHAEAGFAVKHGWVRQEDEYWRFIDMLNHGLHCTQLNPMSREDFPPAFR